jgi:GAF domain-containing protein
MRSHPVVDVAAEIAAATAQAATHTHLRPLSDYLREIREALRMDIAFVSEFVDERRVFAIVDVSAGESTVVPGASDPLLDTYCKRIVSGELPCLIPDAGGLPEAAALPITQALRIGAYLSAPIVLKSGRVFGTLCCLSHAPQPGLRQYDADALAAVANAIAASIDRHGRISDKLSLF